MSGVNTETLVLYANPYLYNGSRFVFYQGANRDDNLTFEDWLEDTSEGISEEMTVYYKSLTEPLELNSPVGDMVKYTYGKLSNDGYEYYIFIDRILTDQHGKSYIHYSVDWWASLWDDVHPTIGHLTRKPTKPAYMAQPYEPLNVTVEQSVITNEFSIMATYIPSKEHMKSEILTIIVPGNNLTLRKVEDGTWISELNMAASDVKDSFVVPLFSYEFIKNNYRTEELYLLDCDYEDMHDAYELAFPGRRITSQETAEAVFVYNEKDGKYYQGHWFSGTSDFGFYEYYRWSELDVDYVECLVKVPVEGGDLLPVKYLRNRLTRWAFLNETPVVPIRLVNVTLHSDEVEKQGIMDFNGNLIWECPYNTTITRFKVSMLKGLSHVMLQFVPEIDGEFNLSTILGGYAFSYDCRHPGIFIDEYREYVLKNREYDIAMRSIQSERQVWQAGVSTIENAAFGFAFGDSATAHKKGKAMSRVPYGAIAAGIGGVIETIGTFMINQEFDPRIQEQYDKRYVRMTDQISIIGDCITNAAYESLLYRYTLTMDVPSQNVMNKDIQVNGYQCNEMIDSVESLFDKGAIIQADNVVIEGACCLDAKLQTVYRLQNGVEFK